MRKWKYIAIIWFVCFFSIHLICFSPIPVIVGLTCCDMIFSISRGKLFYNPTHKTFKNDLTEREQYIFNFEKIKEDREFLIRCWKEDRWRSFKQWYAANHRVVLMNRIGYVRVPPISDIELKEIKFLLHL